MSSVHFAKKFFILNFLIQPNVNDEIVYAITDTHGREEAGVGSGVSRDVYSLFWSEVFDSYMIGADERVPFVRHDLYTSKWEAVGTILMKGYLDFGYFPIFISYCFIHYCLYGEVEENELIDRFLKYLTADEYQIIEVVLKSDSNEVFSF